MVRPLHPGLPRALKGVLFLLLVAVPPLRAQIDYRNLDDDRPTLIEDAYPIERYAFELVAPWRFHKEKGGGNLHALVPELAYGALPNLQIGLKLPVAGVTPEDPADEAGRDWGVAGLRLFALYNFSTDGPVLPALTLRTDATFPVGSLAGEGTRLTVKGIATRSLGLTRLHLNGAYTLGDEAVLGAAEGASKWWYGLAADRTLFRSSTLLIAELYALRSVATAPVEVNASIGLRRQVTPYTVVDVGITRGLRNDVGPQYELTLGLSRAFAVAGLMGGRR